MKIKISELSGIALDWAVAQCEGTASYGLEDFREQRKYTIKHGEYIHRPSTSWSQAGEIIERERIVLGPTSRNTWWAAKGRIGCDEALGHEGPTPLVAAMRCFVQQHHGDEVEVPQELLV